MPMLHAPAVLLATRGRGGRADRVSSRLSTPVLVTDDGQRLCDSSQIVRWASDRFASPETSLYPAEHRIEIEAFEQHVHDRIGAHTRRVAYSLGLGERALFCELARRNVGPRQAWLFARLYPIVRAGIGRGLDLSAARSSRSQARVREHLEALAPRVEGKRYLFGDRFTAADLSLACMFAPVLIPSAAEGFGAHLPALDELPAEAAALVAELRGTPVGRFCLRMFAEERGQREVPCEVDRAPGPVLH